MTVSFAQPSLIIDVSFPMRLPIGVRASIHRVGENGVYGGVRWGHPTNLIVYVRACRKGKALGAKPKPHLADRSQFGEFRKGCVQAVHDGFVGMEANLAVLFSPHEAHGQTAAQLTACGFIANS